MPTLPSPNHAVPSEPPQDFNPDDYYDPEEFYGTPTQQPDAREADALARTGELEEAPWPAEPPPAPPPAPEPSISPTRRQGLPLGRLVWIGLSVVVALAVLSRLITQAPATGQSAVDNTGASRAQTTATSGTLPGRATPTVPTPGASVGQIPAASLVSGPLILINPGIVRQGAGIAVTGSGFDARAIIDLAVKRPGSATAITSTFIQTDKNGAFSGASLTIPESLSAGNFTVSAQERNGSQAAHATGTIADGAPQAKLGAQVGKPGDTIALTLRGFTAGEAIKVYWNALSDQPVASFQADDGGGVGPTPLQVPFGAVGTNTFLFEGTKSQALVAADFLVLSLYPSVTLSSYALQADNILSFTGAGFGPGERVLVFLNNPNDAPIAAIQSDHSGSFKNAGNVLIPFGAKGQQTLIFMGEQSRAPNAVSFTILPYSPVVQPSTYGGLPGTTITFFATAFARNEVVHVYAEHTKTRLGTLVGCFQTSDQGSAAAAGAYLIPGNAQIGPLEFALVGAKSGGIGLASVNVAAPPAPVQTPTQPPFTCPLDQTPPSQQPQPGQTPVSSPTGKPAAGS